MSPLQAIRSDPDEVSFGYSFHHADDSSNRGGSLQGSRLGEAASSPPELPDQATTPYRNAATSTDCSRVECQLSLQIA
jgi:hypothetical protein